MNSELKLIQAIFEKNVKDQDVFLECKIKEQELKYQRRSPRIKIMIINIIKLLWGGNVFYIGNRLIKSKDFIIDSLISIYKNPLKAHILEKDYEKIENYGIIMSLLINSKLLFNEYFYNFFEMFLEYGKVTEILNKIFDKFNLYSHFKCNINVDELIKIINESGCAQNDKFDFTKLNDYMYKKYNLEQEKKVEEKIDTNFDDDDDFISDDDKNENTNMDKNIKNNENINNIRKDNEKFDNKINEQKQNNIIK